MSLIEPGERHFEVRTSRFWALLTFHLTHFIFPPRMAADRHGISTSAVTFWLFPWSREDDHLPMSHVAEIGHDRGLIWDRISVESSGGINPLKIEGLPKSAAGEFVAHVRQIMNK